MKSNKNKQISQPHQPIHKKQHKSPSCSKKFLPHYSNITTRSRTKQTRKGKKSRGMLAIPCALPPKLRSKRTRSLPLSISLSLFPMSPSSAPPPPPSLSLLSPHSGLADGGLGYGIHSCYDIYSWALSNAVT